jgi:hypothetical protein
MKPIDPILAAALENLRPKKRTGRHDDDLEGYKPYIVTSFANGNSLRTVVALLNTTIKPKLGAHTLISFCDRNGIERPRREKDDDTRPSPNDVPSPNDAMTGQFLFPKEEA